MVEYTFEEYTEMLIIYGEAGRNGRAAQRLYHERFPHRPTPSHNIFVRIQQRLRETGTFIPKRADCGAPQTRRTVDFEEEVLHHVEENPSTSTRKIAVAMNVTQSSVWRVLRDQQLHPYHPQKVQAMGPADFAPRANFCAWFLQQCINTPHFPRQVLFTDEAHFTREAVFNCRNSHIWAEENPHATQARAFQQRFGINVWAGIIDGNLIGPYLLPYRLTGPRYLTFLQEVLVELCEDLPLAIRQQMWYQHDGAPAHFSLAVREHLHQTFGERWIGRGGPTSWPPRSPDLTPVDFFLWGHMKNLVYETPVETEEDLVARVMAAAYIIKHTPGLMGRVYDNMLRRYTLCNDHQGRHVEPLL